MKSKTVQLGAIAGTAIVSGMFLRLWLDAPARAESEPQPPSNGRYQLLAQPRSTPFVIDTRTGQVWRYISHADTKTGQIFRKWISMGTPPVGQP